MPVTVTPETIRIDGPEASRIFSNREWFAPSTTDSIAAHAVQYLLGRREDVMASLEAVQAPVPSGNPDYVKTETSLREYAEKSQQLAGEFAADPEETLRRRMGDFSVALQQLTLGDYIESDDYTDGFAVELDASSKIELADYYQTIIVRDSADAKSLLSTITPETTPKDIAEINQYVEMVEERIARLRGYIEVLERRAS